MRAVEIYKSRGMTDEEIKQRLQAIDVRKGFTDTLKFRGIASNFEYALLTNQTYQVFGDEMSAEKIRNTKGLIKGDNIRDNMTSLELQLVQMTEEATKHIILTKNAKGFNEIGVCVDTSVKIV
jgi:hypothetical protein